MAIERFFWTDHAEMRRSQRGIERAAIETTIAEGHFERLENDGRAQWLVRGEGTDGIPFEAVYDHPHAGDGAAVRIVSVWQIDV